MKYRNLLILLLVLALTAGCTAAPVETEPVTTPTDAPTDPPTNPPTEPPAVPETDYQALFTMNGEWMYNLAAGHPFDSPEAVNLSYIFYNGVGFDGSWGSISEAERALLMEAGFWNEIDIQVMPADRLEAMLRRYFGVGLADVRIPDHWAYSEETDTYFSNHNDAYGQAVTVTGHEIRSDGTVLVHLVVDMVEVDEEDWLWEVPMDMTLRFTEDGWQIISNVFAQ